MGFLAGVTLLMCACSEWTKSAPASLVLGSVGSILVLSTTCSLGLVPTEVATFGSIFSGGMILLVLMILGVVFVSEAFPKSEESAAE